MSEPLIVSDHRLDDELREQNARYLLISALVFNPVAFLWFVVDYLLMPAQWQTFLLWRGLSGAAGISLALICFFNTRLRRYSWEFFVLWLLAGFFLPIDAMMPRVGDAFFPYVEGLSIVIYGASFVTVWRPRWTLFSNLVGLSMLVPFFLTEPSTVSTRDLIVGGIILGTNVAMSVVLSWIKYGSASTAFSQRTRLEMNGAEISTGLSRARAVQQGLLPKASDARLFREHAQVWSPAREVSGDWLFCRALPDRTLVGLLQTGESGVSGALLGVSLSAHIERAFASDPSLSPSALLAELDASLRAQWAPLLGAAWAGVGAIICDFKTGSAELRVAGAGGSYYSSRAQRGQRFVTPGRRLGAGDGAPFGPDKSVAIEPNTTIALVSDGLTKERGGDLGLEFGHLQLAKLLGEIEALPVAAQAVALQAGIDRYQAQHVRRFDHSAFLFRA